MLIIVKDRMNINITTLKDNINSYVKDYIAIDTENTQPEQEKEQEQRKPTVFDEVLKQMIDAAYIAAIINDLVTKKIEGIRDAGEEHSAYVKRRLDCLKRPLSNPKELGSNTYVIDKKTIVQIDEVYFRGEEESIETMRNNIKLEFAIQKKAGELGVGLKCIEAYVCSNGDEHFKVIYSEAPKGLVALNQWLHPVGAKRRLTDAQSDLALKQVRAHIDKLHKSGIICSSSDYRHSVQQSIYIVPKTGGKTIDQLYITDFSKAINVEQSRKRLIENDMLINPFRRYNQKSKVFQFVIDKLFKNKDIVISE